jgi:hypothetical protein
MMGVHETPSHEQPAADGRRRVTPLRSVEEPSFLRSNNEACLTWLEDALRRLRSEGQTRVAGYLEAVSEEVLFEMKLDPSAVNYGVAHSTEGTQALEEGTCSGCW